MVEEETLEPTEEELEEAEDTIEDEDEEQTEERFQQNMDLQDEYAYPQEEQKHNAHVIINKALDRTDTVRTTFLTESELGRPLFSVRFLSDLHDMALRHNLPIITAYFWEKIQNITSSGMSNKGFVMNLNVTQKRDSVKRRTRDPIKEGEIKK